MRVSTIGSVRQRERRLSGLGYRPLITAGTQHHDSPEENDGGAVHDFLRLCGDSFNVATHYARGCGGYVCRVETGKNNADRELGTHLRAHRAGCGGVASAIQTCRALERLFQRAPTRALKRGSSFKSRHHQLMSLPRSKCPGLAAEYRVRSAIASSRSPSSVRSYASIARSSWPGSADGVEAARVRSNTWRALSLSPARAMTPPARSLDSSRR